jgi:hypothetical protein
VKVEPGEKLTRVNCIGQFEYFHESLRDALLGHRTPDHHLSAPRSSKSSQQPYRAKLGYCSAHLAEGLVGQNKHHQKSVFAEAREAAPGLLQQAVFQKRKSMKTITAISWNEERVYHRIEVPWPEEGDERKPSRKPKDMVISDADFTAPASDQAVTQEEQPVELVDATSLGIAA